MKSLSLIGAGILVLAAAAAVPVSAQQDRRPPDANSEQPSRDKDKAQQHQDKNRPEQPAKGQAQQRQQPQRTNPPAAKAQPRERARQAGRPAPVRRQIERGDERSTWQQQRAHSWDSEHRTWKQRGGYHGYRIPQVRYRAYFGRDRWFRLYGAPMVMVGRYPRFRYAGYWFRLADPWPESWADDWYERDDVSIDYYQDGYYLFNRNHPGVYIAVQVYAN